MAPVTVSQHFKEAARRAGVQDVHFHDLRHEAISRLADKGMNTLQLSTVSGHKTLSILKRYTHTKAEALHQFFV